MEQNALTLITRIKPEQRQALDALLQQIGDSIRNNTANPYIDFSQILTLHFACMVVLESDPNFAPCLVFESNYDGTQEDHLRELIRKAGAGIDAIYSKCEGYPAEGVKDPEKVLTYLNSVEVATPAFYIG